MNTLEELKAGKLKGATSLKLSCGLDTFPEEILTLADTLELLDLSGNHLQALPSSFAQLQKLKILFLSFNQFKKIPPVIAQCKNLSMLGLKSNQIDEIPEDIFPLSLRWLILTDNKIVRLPRSMKKLIKLEKLALAGNSLESLPDEMAQCKNLGLVRFSANALKTVPSWLATLERLAWFAIAGNPCVPLSSTLPSLPLVPWSNIEIFETLGQGASGTTYKAFLKKENSQLPVAVKIFKNEVTSDGYPLNEIHAHRLVSGHPHIIPITAELINVPEGKRAVLLELVPATYTALGNIPSFESCTRDCYPAHTEFSSEVIIAVALQIASAAQHLHRCKVMHGDLYAHNILHERTTQRTLLGDFGAATYYGGMALQETGIYEKTDVLAYGYLLEELLSRHKESSERKNISALVSIKTRCLGSLAQRPTFDEISHQLSKYYQ